MTPEDEKLVALARSSRARIQALQGAAVRDETGRSYGATVDLPSLQLSALNLAVAQAVSPAQRVWRRRSLWEEIDIASVRDLGVGVPVYHQTPRHAAG